MVDTGQQSPKFTTAAASHLACRRRMIRPYAVAVPPLAAGLAVKLAFASTLRGEASYLLYIPAVLIASALSGWGPALLATVLGLAFGLFFVSDVRPLGAPHALSELVFALASRA